MDDQIPQSRGSEVCIDLFVTRVPLWLQVSNEVAIHQQLSLAMPLLNGRNGDLYGRSIVQGDIVLNNIPTRPHKFQLKSDTIRAMEIDRLQCEVICLMVEHGNAATMRNWRLVGRGQIPS